MEILKSNLEELMNISYKCSCGKEHKVATRKVYIEKGALEKCSDIINELSLGNKAVMVADKHTFEAAGEKLFKLLNEKGFEIKLCILDEDELHADEKSIGSVLIDTDKDSEFIIGVGTGTINDICRYVSFRLNIHYMIVGTAPSMDGYASTVSPLMVKGFKITYEATHPTAIIGDLDVLCNAPSDMIAAGVGDMLGKLTALSDWILAKYVDEEYYCSTIVNMMKEAVKVCIYSAEGAAKREPSAVKALMEGLILSGIAMQMCGNSRPASGAEHHLSHYIEMQDFMKGNKSALHGIKVGMSVLIIMDLYKHLLEYEVENIEIREKNNEEKNRWSEEVKTNYKSLAENIITSHKFPSKEKLNLIYNNYKQNYITIKEEIYDIFHLTKDAASTINKIGGAVTPEDLNISKSEILKAVLYAKEVRERYTVLKLCDEFGLLEKFAKDII